MTISSNHYTVRRGSETWRRRYVGIERKIGVPSALNEGPVCNHGPDCEVRALWPLPGETHEQMKARLRAALQGVAG